MDATRSDPLRRDPRLRTIATALHARKASDVLLMDLRSVSDVADYFILCTATSDPHIKSLVTDLVDELKDSGHRPWHVEGLEQRRWVLVDLVDIVIHVFRPDAREYYALERLWGDAECTELQESGPSDSLERDEIAI